MRQIKASEVKPGMTVRWEQDGAKIQLPVHSVEAGVASVGLVAPTKTQWCLGAKTPVTVLSEPQPVEPTAFGAKVRVRKGRFVRLVEGDAGFRVWFEEGTESWWTWDDLCEMGPVTAVPDQGWAVPADTPEAPDRTEEWDIWEDVPEGVVVANPEMLYQYRKACGKNEVLGRIGGGVWGETRLHLGAYPGPWTRVSDA